VIAAQLEQQLLGDPSLTPAKAVAPVTAFLALYQSMASV